MAFKVTIGQYYREDSIMHKLDARIKMILTVVFALAIFFASGPLGNGLVALALLGLCLLSRVPLKIILSSIKPILFFLIFTIFANLFFVRTGDLLFSLGPLEFYYDGVWAAFFLSLRFFFLMILGSLLTLTTSPVELTDATERLTSPLERFGFPSHELAMVLSIALRFIPTLSTETERIMRAQTARGASFTEGSLRQRIKMFIPILVPLFASSIRHAENLATAMEARCYTGGEGRTHYRERSIDKFDITALIVFIAFLVVFILVRIFLP